MITTRTIAWTGFIAVAAFALMVAGRMTVLAPVENLTLGVTQPVRTALRDGTRPLADWVNNLTDAGALSSENRRLRADNERLTSDLVRARESQITAEDIKNLAAVEAQFPDDSFLTASVIARESSNLRSLIAIDRGSADGLKVGMIVVTEGRSLVGTITKVVDQYAWIRLISDPKSAVSAIVQESRAEGVVAGNYGGDLRMEFVGQGAAVSEGDFVITSGIGGGYPKGVVIGRVGKVQKSEQDLFQSVTVNYLASLAKLQHVLVLTSFVPLSLAQP